ncbi:peptidyl-prolyl cis-trans isomerase [Leptolyngbya sp. 7M]|uniref:peptidylprolyl isomerase n=1 Tax=Leptolyngbya sp. 7M TaxID=2812896 RepID=UPI001B8D678F|nr:peptidyl-prolyl cis-trans isomerase [Leptolyngbya sp. 7M]QYO66263.1 peptidyl-prolyl cis-trans isomerase [Leptolyngbya sp. 7M]QYU70915.1 peptidyl-prolyl cis-trans isomerase [Leptolyngbya sp. 15MV]
MNKPSIAALLAVVVFAFTASASAQETEIRVVDEVIAQVNEGVITLSRVKREMKAIIDQEVSEGKSREEAERLLEEKKGELIANLINEELVLQRAKEIKLDSEIDATLNRRLLEIMQNANIKTLEALYQEMERQGINPQEMRDVWRRQITRDLVIQQEVQRAEYWRPTNSEVRTYYEANKQRFTKPETVSVSEIFLSFAGRNEGVVRENAKQLLTRLRAGEDFAKLQKENSDPGQLTQGQGKAERLVVADLVEVISKPLAGVKVGGFTEPIEIDQLGIILLRVDAREAASSESEFNENAVRSAMLQARFPEAQKAYMSNLRKDAYIKLNEEYRPLVAPLLFAEERNEKATKN